MLNDASRKTTVGRTVFTIIVSGLAMVAVGLGLITLFDGNDGRYHVLGFTFVPHHTGVLAVRFPWNSIWQIDNSAVWPVCAIYFLWCISWLVGMPTMRRPAVREVKGDETRRGFAVVVSDEKADGE